MAHEIEDDRFIAKDGAWHDRGLQNVVGLTVEQAIQQVHPELLVKVPMQGILEDGHTLEAPDCYGVYRSDGKFLAAVGGRFEVVQPIDDFARFQDLIDTGLVELTTAGVLLDGKKIFITAKVKDSCREIVKDDLVDLYFTLASGTCGNMNHRRFLAGERTVCANTLRIAERQGKANGTHKGYRHTKTIHAKLDQWIMDVKESLVDWEGSVQAYKAIAAKPIKSEAHLQSYIDSVFEVDRTEEVSSQTDNKVRHVLNLFHTGRGTELVEANYWKAYNAVTEYLTYDYGNSADTRQDSLMFGESSRISGRALDLAIRA